MLGGVLGLPCGALGPKGVPGEKKTSFWDFLPPSPGPGFSCFFDFVCVIFHMFFERVFGRPPDTILEGFGDDLGHCFVMLL